MKKILILSIVSLSALTMKAQVKFGIKAGVNLSKFTGSDAKMDGTSPKFKTGFTGGALVKIPVNEMLSVQPELLYSMEGSRYEEDGAKFTYKTDYINIPVMVQYNNPSGFYAETGPQVGFLASAKARIKTGSIDASEDAKDNFKGINFAWGLGAGYKLHNGFGIGARYNFGLANIADGEENDDTKVQLSGLHVGVFYTFGAGSKK